MINYKFDRGKWMFLIKKVFTKKLYSIYVKIIIFNINYFLVHPQIGHNEVKILISGHTRTS